MDTRKLLEFWNKNLPEKVDYASLVCAEGFASGFKYVYEDEYGYVVEETMKKLEELFDYELLEEQGLLLRLPCKIGSTIYLIDYEQQSYDEATVDSFTFEDGKILINSDYEIGIWSEDTYVVYSLEQAEQKLKELQEGEKE